MKQDGSLGQRAGQRAIRMMGFIKVLIDRLIVGDDLRLDEDLYRAGRPIIRKVLKIRIWVVPPVCFGSR